MQRRWLSWGLGFHLLACLFLYQITDVMAANFKTELRTKLLLSNIRSHLAKQVDQVVQQKECDSGLILCQPPKEKEASPEESEELPPEPKIRGLHKPTVKVNQKDVIQNMIHKAYKTHPKKAEKDDHENVKRSVKSQVEKSEETKNDSFKDEDEMVVKKLKKEEKTKETQQESNKVQQKSNKPSKEGKVNEKMDEKEGISFPKTLPVFTAASPVVESEICRKHSRVFLRQLQRYKMWAMLMYDASAKLPSGILQGNVNQFGDFDECLTVNAVMSDKSMRKQSEVQSIQGRYCLAAIDVESVADVGALRQAVDRAEAHGFIRSKAKNAGYFIPRFTTIKWGVCVPSSCSAKDVEKALEEQLSRYNDTSGISFNVIVDENACADRDDLNFSFRVGTIMTLIFYLAVFGTAVFATYIDVKTKNQENDNENGKTVSVEQEQVESDAQEGDQPATTKEASKQGKLNKLLMAFSFKRNLQDLLSSGTDEDIACIHGIKAIFTAMLYIAHKTVPLALTPYQNRIQLTKLANQPGSTVLRTSIIYTDSFLLVSGVLTSFNLTREILSNGRIGWIRRLTSRVVRLTPPLLAVILFYAYVAEQLGSGPQWGPLVGKNAELCRENFWSNLLYIQNFFNFEEMCAPQTHQLALDMQLSLTAPLLIYALYHYGIIGLLLLQLVYLLSSVLRYITTFNYQLALVFFHGVTVTQLYDTANLLYSQAIYRATPYVMGVIIGFYLRKKANKLKEHLQRPLAAIGWIIAICLAFLSVVTPTHLANRTYEYNVQEAAQYAALSPISWSLALGWLIAACHLGYGGRLNDVLSSWPLVVLSRISYSVYLIQFLVFNHNVATIRGPKVFSLATALDLTEMGTIVILSVMLTLLFDIPMKEVKVILFDRNKAPVEEDKNKNEEENKKELTHGEKQVEIDQEQDFKENDDLVDEDYDGATYPPGYEEDEVEEAEDEEEEIYDDEEETNLRRSNRVLFGDDDDKNFWIEDHAGAPLEDDDVDRYWGDED